MVLVQVNAFEMSAYVSKFAQSVLLEFLAEYPITLL